MTKNKQELQHLLQVQKNLDKCEKIIKRCRRQRASIPKSIREYRSLLISEIKSRNNMVKGEQTCLH